MDDAIVVIENTHRVFDNGKVPIRKAAKIAAGEIFIPVFSGTLVVLAPFVPLAFLAWRDWQIHDVPADYPDHCAVGVTGGSLYYQSGVCS